MANILLLSPVQISSVTTTRGSGAENLLTADPKEVWADTAVNTSSTIAVDLGAVRTIDTISLVAVYGAAAGASWTITGGIAGQGEFSIQAASALRASDASGQMPFVSHAFWRGAAISARYVSIALTQPGGSPPLMVGRAVCGQGFTPAFNKEWGSGRRVIDTGSSNALPSGGFSNVEGVRKAGFAWTLGDLSDAEVETLYALQLELGETVPLLVVEDPAPTAGLRNRIHYGLFRSLKQFERRNPKQTRWEFTMEEWV